MPGSAIDPSMIAQLLSSIPGAAGGGAGEQMSRLPNPPIQPSQPPTGMQMGGGFDNFVSQLTGDDTGMHPLLRLLKHTKVNVATPGFAMSMGQQGGNREAMMGRILEQLSQGGLGGQGGAPMNDEVITMPGNKSGGGGLWESLRHILSGLSGQQR